jgi:hypothetical protein
VEEALLTALDRIGTALEELTCYAAAQFRLARHVTEYGIESEQRADERAEKVATAALRRAEETHESHELGMALLGQRTPDGVPEDWLAAKPNREQRRKARRQ